jgi:hypothetical protein
MIIDSESKKSSELAISLAKQETNENAIIAQKREFIVCRITQLKNEIARTKVSTKCIILFIIILNYNTVI